MKVKELNELVIAEAKALKSKATKSELSNLDFFNLEPTLHNRCIYGQMTSSCFSSRAHELIESCCANLINGEIGGYITPIANRKKVANIRRDYLSGDSRWSPIEVFIAREINLRNGNVKKLIAYLRDETKELVFK